MYIIHVLVGGESNARALELIDLGEVVDLILNPPLILTADFERAAIIAAKKKSISRVFSQVLFFSLVSKFLEKYKLQD